MAGESAKAALAGSRFADVRWFGELDSTNTWALEEGRSGAPEGLVAVADYQSAGRGRLGRRWIAPPGRSLLASILFRPALPAERLHLLTVAVALAAADACIELAGVDAALKWPNDLLIGDRKVAGILAESIVCDDGGRAVVVGIGINVEWPSDLPEEIAATATALNLASGQSVDREELLVLLLRGLDQRYPPTPGLVEEFRRRCTTLGQRVRVDTGGDVLEGTATDVDGDGLLVLQTDDGAERKLAVGDVVHLRPAPPT